MSSIRWTWSLSGVVALGLALNAGSCSSGSSGTTGSGSGGSDASTDGTTGSCTSDAQCASTVPPTTPANCATGKCNTVQSTCEYVAKDEDGDGHAAANCKSTSGVAVQDGDDCNDHDPNLYPGHPEACALSTDAGLGCAGQWICLSDGSESACNPTVMCNSDESCVDGTMCTKGCDIGGTAYTPNQANPSNPCQSCQPGSNTSAWTTLPEGTGCGKGDVCASGTCGSQCFIGGSLYASGASNPSNQCQVCTPGSNTTGWSPAATGSACASDGGTPEYCQGQVCTSGCLVAGTFWASGAANPNDPCQICTPSVTTTNWTALKDGASCGGGQVCAAGQCGSQCDIGGTFYSSGTLDPTNKCESCQPGTNTAAWTNLASGSSCGTGQVCDTGTCASGCFIAGFLYQPGVINPGNVCQLCQPTTSGTSWSSVTDGTNCGTGVVCNAGSCVANCFIGGTLYPPGAADPSNPCETCQPTISTTMWTTVVDGTSCTAGTCCTGTCVDTSTDGNNCGACGHSCRGAACASAMCGAATLATGQSQPQGIAVDTTNVYWVNYAQDMASGSVAKVPIAGGGVTTLASSRTGPWGIAITSSDVYWSEDGAQGVYMGLLMSVPVVGGSVSTLGGLGPVAEQPYGVAVNGGELYWADWYGGVVGALGLGGGNPVTLYTNTASGPTNLAADATSVYWTDSFGNVMKVPRGGGTVTTLASSLSNPWGIAIDAANVYWTNSAASGSVMKVPLSGGTVSTVVAGQNTPHGIAVDGTYLYWTNLTATGTVLRVPLSGGSVTTLASMQNQPYAIAVNSTGVYWTNFGAGTVIGILR